MFESSNISETGEVTPTKIGVHVCYIKAYMLKAYRLIFGATIINSIILSNESIFIKVLNFAATSKN